MVSARRCLSAALTLFGTVLAVPTYAAPFQAGAVVIDVTPQTLPVIVNGGMRSRTVEKIGTPLHARALALASGKTKLVIVVVDSCMMPRPLLDQAKRLASGRTGIPTDHMLVSATHTHSAGSCMGALGTPPDPKYVPFLTSRVADTIVAAEAALQPARIGFASAQAPQYTALRRWIRRPDRIANDPFGNPTVRANMHAAKNLDDVTGESGPEDPELSMICVQTRDRKPLAVLANFSMHYFGGEKGISADYFGFFCEGLKKRIAAEGNFVGIMSHGCSGDIWRRDYARPDSWKKLAKIDEYAEGLAEIAAGALKSVEYQDDIDLAMVERRMTLKYRVPDKQRLEWSRQVVKGIGDRLPRTKEEIYAKEQLVLHKRQQTEIVIQALRIGDIAIATTPNETYAITGLKIKAASPISNTMVIELANGADGYIPPPEQHLLGGYNTWPARSAGLEVMAEPKIAESCIRLLEQVAGKPRRRPTQSRGPAASAIERLQPLAWYRLDEFAGPDARDSTRNRRDGIYESAVTYYLEGPKSDRFCRAGEPNRAAMFAGGRLRTRHPNLGKQWSVSLWFWNGMPSDGRGVTGWLLSGGNDHGLAAFSTHIGIGGTSGHSGRLIFQSGADETSVVAGKTRIPRWRWQHVAFVRDGASVRVYLNGQQELAARAPVTTPTGFEHLFFGGRSDNESNWEGRLDEIAVIGRALTAEQVTELADLD
ncbi:MAG: hypothetical protein OER86_10155 [Phycisphaerae bacterium]|nr:hypothetical protein [Phycisphaerae bacterium]